MALVELLNRLEEQEISAVNYAALDSYLNSETSVLKENHEQNKQDLGMLTKKTAHRPRGTLLYLLAKNGTSMPWPSPDWPRPKKVVGKRKTSLKRLNDQEKLCWLLA